MLWLSALLRLLSSINYTKLGNFGSITLFNAVIFNTQSFPLSLSYSRSDLLIGEKQAEI
jgi:hypothetical protein